MAIGGLVHALVAGPVSLAPAKVTYVRVPPPVDWEVQVSGNSPVRFSDQDGVVPNSFQLFSQSCHPQVNAVFDLVQLVQVQRPPASYQAPP